MITKKKRIFKKKSPKKIQQLIEYIPFATDEFVFESKMASTKSLILFITIQSETGRD